MSSRDFGLIQISSIGTCPSWNCDLNFSHDGNVAKMVPKWVDPWEITRKEYDIWTIFATQNRRYTL